MRSVLAAWATQLAILHIITQYVQNSVILCNFFPQYIASYKRTQFQVPQSLLATHFLSRSLVSSKESVNKRHSNTFVRAALKWQRSVNLFAIITRMMDHPLSGYLKLIIQRILQQYVSPACPFLHLHNQKASQSNEN